MTKICLPCPGTQILLPYLFKPLKETFEKGQFMVILHKQSNMSPGQICLSREITAAKSGLGGLIKAIFHSSR